MRPTPCSVEKVPPNSRTTVSKTTCRSPAIAATFTELIPADVRVTGIGIPYSLVNAGLGDTAPLVSAAFIDAGHPDLIAVYVSVVMLVAGLFWVTMPETRDRSIDAEQGPATEQR
ncbi:hypothetical protein [Streptomyces winkii]|uniref:hypothetical protein n=1 Tax=Streptomyces winkii TaxID=3051178 RepID=UPI0028D0BFF0|nr:hypothetical protein [Streptomyces sp. DSM 40971]